MIERINPRDVSLGAVCTRASLLCFVPEPRAASRRPASASFKPRASLWDDARVQLPDTTDHRHQTSVLPHLSTTYLGHGIGIATRGKHEICCSRPVEGFYCQHFCSAFCGIISSNATAIPSVMSGQNIS